MHNLGKCLTFVNGDVVCKNKRKQLPGHIVSLHHKESALYFLLFNHIFHVIKLDFNGMGLDANNRTNSTID